MDIRITATHVKANGCTRVAEGEVSYFFANDQRLPDDFVIQSGGSTDRDSLSQEGISYVRISDRAIEVFADYRGWNHLYFFLGLGEPAQLILTDSPLAFAGHCPIDWEVLKLVPILGHIPAPLSPVQGTRRLRPGERIVFDRTTLRPTSSDTLLPSLLTSLDRPSSRHDHELIRETLLDATATRVQGTKSPIVFLSGGFDSSLLVHLLRSVGAEPAAWTATYGSHVGERESARAAAAANHFGIPWTQVSVGEREVGEHMQGILDAMLEPTADVATLAEGLLAVQAAKECPAPVVFEGEGMDSLLCGSYKFVAERYRRVLGPLLRLIPNQAPVSETRASRAGSLALKLRQLRGILHGGDPLERHFRFNFSEHEAIDLMPEVRAEVWDVFKSYYDLLPEADTLTRLSCMTFFNIRGNRKLRLIERYSGVRFELVYQDLDFVRLAFALPADRKVSFGYGKRILRDAFADVVPPAVKGRAKLSFTFPVLDYFSDRDIQDLCDTRLGDNDAIRRSVEAHRSGQADHLPFLWGVFVANQWAHRYEAAESRASIAGK